MVRQYPYRLFIFAQGNVSEQSTDLSFPAAINNEWSYHCKCRDEQNTNTNTVGSVDGIHYNYSYLIQLPKGSPEIQVGDQVKVLDCDGNERCNGIVQMYKKDQLHSRIWL